MTGLSVLPIERIRRAVDRSAWLGRAGTTELVVMREFIAEAESRGALMFALSLRSVAERINVSVSTVWNAVRRLKGRGFLKVARAARRPEHATIFRLRRPPRRHNSEHVLLNYKSPLTDKECSDLHVHSDLDITVAADVWSGPGGKTRHRVWASLLRLGPRTCADLARDAEVSESTVRRILPLLEALGLAIRSGRLWRVGNADPYRAADALGTTGAGDRRRVRHRHERAAFREALKWVGRLEVNRETGEVLAVVDPEPRQRVGGDHRAVYPAVTAGSRAQHGQAGAC